MSHCGDCMKVKQRLRVRHRRSERRVWQPRDPCKENARQAVHYALKTGSLIRRPCERCASPVTDAHHDDYRKPLDVRWLCRRHHAMEHWTPVDSPISAKVQAIRLAERKVG